MLFWFLMVGLILWCIVIAGNYESTKPVRPMTGIIGLLTPEQIEEILKDDTPEILGGPEFRNE